VYCWRNDFDKVGTPKDPALKKEYEEYLKKLEEICRKRISCNIDRSCERA
jgi:hypothetical protein